MLIKTKLYTVESVTSGHPDKICDQISDAILDECLRQDPFSRVAIETFACHDQLIIGGELTSRARIDVENIAREVYRSIGYDDSGVQVATHITKQSPDIAMGVDLLGAGDQGIMYGYACKSTNDMMPYGVGLAHKLSQGLEDLRKSERLTWLRPDGKSQLTIEDGAIRTVLVSTQHASGISQEEIEAELKDKLIEPLLGDLTGIEVLVNPTGKFVVGGMEADTGLTGRKIMVDTYGGLIPHGGGAFSGKDATKVDRSAAYMARYVAKNLVRSAYGEEILVSLAYAIGREQPLMVQAINEKGEQLGDLARKKFDFRPQAIIERLELRNPIFQKTAIYGHFGKEGLLWEDKRV